MKTLREAREERGIKQKAVADALKVARQTYAKYEENPRLRFHWMRCERNFFR